MLKRLVALLVLPTALLFAGSALAAPISMNPGSVTIETVLGVGNDFTLTFDGGDTSDNVLDFTAHGGGGTGFMGMRPSTGLAAIVFQGTSIIDSGDTIGGTFNPGNVVRGITLPGTGIAAALLVDIGSASSESFFIQLASTPTTATIYSLSASLPSFSTRTFGQHPDLHEWLKGAIDKQEVRFVTAIPEPSAALVFAVGLLVTRGAIRRR